MELFGSAIVITADEANSLLGASDLVDKCFRPDSAVTEHLEDRLQELYDNGMDQTYVLRLNEQELAALTPCAKAVTALGIEALSARIAESHNLGTIAITGSESQTADSAATEEAQAYHTTASQFLGLVAARYASEALPV